MVKCIRINNYANNKIIIHSIQKRLIWAFSIKYYIYHNFYPLTSEYIGCIITNINCFIMHSLRWRGNKHGF